MTHVLDRPAAALGRPIAVLLNRLLRLSGRRAGLVLLYHRVGDPPGDPARELVPARGAARFEAELRHFMRRYRVVPASEILREAAKRRRGERFPLAITFDDDLASHAEAAAPILRRHGAPATFFVCGATFDGPFAFWWELLQAAFDQGRSQEALAAIAEVTGRDASTLPTPIHPLAAIVEELEPERRDAVAERLRAVAGPDGAAGLTAEQLRGLAAEGFAIGFHTRRHDRLPPLSDERLDGALRDGRDRVARAAGYEPRSLAYPHGRADARVAAHARAAGYELGFTASPAPAGTGTDPHLIGRLEPSARSLGRTELELVKVLAAALRGHR